MPPPGLSATSSVEEAERTAVERALNPAAMAPLLLGGTGSETGPLRDGRVEILDVKYRPGKSFSVLYRVDGAMVLGILGWPGANGRSEVEPALALHRWPDDPALPVLAEIVDPEVMGSTLVEAVEEWRSRGLRAVRCRVLPVRYRPGRRCTLRVDLWLRPAGNGPYELRTVFAKVYHDESKSGAVWDEMRALAAIGESPVAAPAAYLPQVPMVVQFPVSGTPLDLYLGRADSTRPDPRAAAGFALAARALARVHNSGVTSSRLRPALDELDKMKGRAELAAAVDASVGDLMLQTVAGLDARYEALPGAGESALVHGDCKPDQFLLEGSRVSILDFDHCGMADPATDVATFVATLTQLRAKRALAGGARSEWLVHFSHSFLDDYCSAAGRDRDFRERVTWYHVQALLRKALRGFARSTRSPLPRALLHEGLALLETTGATRTLS